jgi:DNA-binding IclR family transcriptional regulator
MVDKDGSGAAKLLAILEALSVSSGGGSAGGLTVAGLGRALGKDKSTVSRQLRPLVDLGLVEKTDDGVHRLGWRLFTLAAQAGDQRLLLLAAPVMRRLADVTKERVHLSVLRGRDVFTILSESSRQVIEAVDWVGRTAPLHCTSTGRVLLLDHSDDEIRCLLGALPFSGPGPRAPADVEDLLDRIHKARAEGFALVDGEFDADLMGAAAPVRDFSGRIVAALNVSAPSYRLGTRLSWVGQQVAAAAAHLSNVAASRPPTE